jgi:hypothetical protein
MILRVPLGIECRVCITLILLLLSSDGTELYHDIVTDLINVLPGNSPVNTVQCATIEEAVFSVDPTNVPVDWLDSDHVKCVYCGSMSVTRPYK